MATIAKIREADKTVDEKDHVQKLAERLKAYQRESGKSWKHIAVEMGYSKSAVQAFASGTYKHKPGRRNGLDASVANYLARMSGVLKGADGGTAFINLLTSRIIDEAVVRAIRLNEICLLVGPAGIGKTFGLMHVISARSSLARYVMITCHAKTSPKSLMLALADMLDVQMKGTTDAILRAVIKRLKRNSACIVIDEANFLDYDSFNLVRAIWDAARVPVILAGTMKLFNQIRNNKESAGELEQLYSRIGQVRHLPGLEKRELKTILCDAFGEVDDNTFNEFASNAGGFPNVSLRRIQQLITGVVELQAINKTIETSPEFVKRAASLTVTHIKY